MYSHSLPRALLVPRPPNAQCSHLLLPSKATRRRLHNPVRSMLDPTRLPIHESRLTYGPRALSDPSSLRRAMRAGSAVGLPVVPAPRVLAHVRVSSLSRDACCSPAPHARLAEEDDLFA